MQHSRQVDGLDLRDDDDRFSDEPNDPTTNQPPPVQSTFKMPKQVHDIKQFIELCRRKDASCRFCPKLEDDGGPSSVFAKIEDGARDLFVIVVYVWNLS